MYIQYKPNFNFTVLTTYNLTTGDFKTGAKRYTVFMVDFPHTINSKTGTGILYQNL